MFEIGYYTLDADNRPVRTDLLSWGEMMNGNRRFVGYTEITSELRVSTVFIGIDHRHYGKGPPLLFETMIFGGPLDGHQWRYASWDDAQTGHQAAVSKAHKAIGHKFAQAIDEIDNSEIEPGTTIKLTPRGWKPDK